MYQWKKFLLLLSIGFPDMLRRFERAGWWQRCRSRTRIWAFSSKKNEKVFFSKINLKTSQKKDKIFWSQLKKRDSEKSSFLTFRYRRIVALLWARGTNITFKLFPSSTADKTFYTTHNLLAHTHTDRNTYTFTQKERERETYNDTRTNTHTQIETLTYNTHKHTHTDETLTYITHK